MISFFRSVTAALRRWLSRRAARRLLSQQLPKGLPPPARPFTLALRVPAALEPPPGEYWTLPLGAQAVRGEPPHRLLRLSALPAPPRKLDVVREPPARPEPPRLRLPQVLEIAEPLRTRVRDLGQARPEKLRLDADLRLPPEIDPPRIAADAPPPAPPRRVRPRTPLPRAPVYRLRLRNFRLDNRTHAPANEGIVPLEHPDVTWAWVHPELRREKIDLPWMAQERIRFLGPMQTEWFVMWWEEISARKPGGKEPRHYQLPEELFWALEQCKEQILIRRDVKKDETVLEEPKLESNEVGIAIAQMQSEPVTGMIPPKQWVESAEMLEPLPFDRGLREAYLRWRTLIDALEER